MNETESIEIDNEKIFYVRTTGGEQMLINSECEGLCRTIKAQYYKNSLANFIRTGSTFGATGVIECIKH